MRVAMAILLGISALLLRRWLTVVVPEGMQDVVVRGGRMTRTLHSGRNFVVPGAEHTIRVRVAVDGRPFSTHAMTFDGATVRVRGTVLFHVVDARSFLQCRAAVNRTASTRVDAAVCEVALEHTCDELVRKRAVIAEECADAVGGPLRQFGLIVDAVDIGRIDVLATAPPRPSGARC